MEAQPDGSLILHRDLRHDDGEGAELILRVVRADSSFLLRSAEFRLSVLGTTETHKYVPGTGTQALWRPTSADDTAWASKFTLVSDDGSLTISVDGSISAGSATLDVAGSFAGSVTGDLSLELVSDAGSLIHHTETAAVAVESDGITYQLDATSRREEP